jgi:glycosyltransferase involved in cell wall biosynthesis
VKFLCIVDKKGRIQCNRLKKLETLCRNISFTIQDINSKSSPSKFDKVYYSHFSLLRKKPFNGPKLASITSHKCFRDMQGTLKALKSFEAISVNNTILLQHFKKHINNLYYTPNGVDTSFFVPPSFMPDFSSKLVIGWVGNKDRDVKNYATVLKPLIKRMKSKSFEFKVVASSKGDKESNLLKPVQMRDYYQSLDVFLVTSSAEGTPNPALEALACGVPVITTRVGNMIEIVNDGKNSFFVDGSIKSYERKLQNIFVLGEDYKTVRLTARKSILEWDWNMKYKAWENFFMH